MTHITSLHDPHHVPPCPYHVPSCPYHALSWPFMTHNTSLQNHISSLDDDITSPQRTSESASSTMSPAHHVPIHSDSPAYITSPDAHLTAHALCTSRPPPTHTACLHRCLRCKRLHRCLRCKSLHRCLRCRNSKGSLTSRPAPHGPARPQQPEFQEPVRGEEPRPLHPDLPTPTHVHTDPARTREAIRVSFSSPASPRCAIRVSLALSARPLSDTSPSSACPSAAGSALQPDGGRSAPARTGGLSRLRRGPGCCTQRSSLCQPLSLCHVSAPQPVSRARPSACHVSPPHVCSAQREAPISPPPAHTGGCRAHPR